MHYHEHASRSASQDVTDRIPPGVDVAIPCYEYGRFLRDCVTSVLTQGIRGLRVLIIDNASSDDSVEVAKQLAAEDRRVEVAVHQSNLGPHVSFNEGIDWARSEYFMVLSADDLLAPGCLASAISIMEQHPNVGLAQGRAVAVGPQSPTPVFDPDTLDTPWSIIEGLELLKRLCRTAVFSDFAGCSFMLVRTSVQKLAGYYRPELPHSYDHEMWMRLACLGSIAKTEARLGGQRIHGSNMSSLCSDHYETLRRCEAAFESFFAHEGSLLPDAGRLHRLARRSLGEHAYWSALASLCRGEARGCWNLLTHGVRLCPTTAIVPPVNYLFRRDDALRRIISIASQMVGWQRAPVREGARSDG
jgi:glycosyltransferase involved in cell wall biosynthesis